MEWTFTGEVIEWRGPAPNLFVAMTPEDSEDLREQARGLIYWGQVPVHVTIGDAEFTTALLSQGWPLPRACQGGGAASSARPSSPGTRVVPSSACPSSWLRG
jgi:hypothetical protein